MKIYWFILFGFETVFKVLKTLCLMISCYSYHVFQFMLTKKYDLGKYGFDFHQGEIKDSTFLNDDNSKHILI